MLDVEPHRLEHVDQEVAPPLVYVVPLLHRVEGPAQRRDAHALDFCNIVLADGCAAFSDEAHEATITSLATIADIATCEQVINTLQG